MRRDYPAITGAPADLRLLLPARAESLAIVRQALAGLGEAIGLDSSQIADINVAVSEAASNVVVHAYDGGEGPLEVESRTGERELLIVVRDQGSGMQSRAAEHATEVLGIGLSLIATLCDGFDLRGGLEGTEVWMRFAFGSEEDPDRGPSEAPTCTGLSVSPELAGPVLSRIVATIAARAGVAIDRVGELQSVCDAIADAAPSAAGNGSVEFEIAERPEGLELRVGPLATGGGERLLESLEVPGLGSLQRFLDETRIEPGEGGERLLLRVGH